MKANEGIMPLPLRRRARMAARSVRAGRSVRRGMFAAALPSRFGPWHDMQNWL
jgi:hypothetical protein